MKGLLISVAICVGLPAQAAQAPAVIDSAKALADACRPVQRSLANPSLRRRVPLESGLLCLGYMQAMQDISVLADEQGRRVLGACPPETSSLGDLIDAFVTYADAHRDQLDGSAGVPVIKSFQDAFPCVSSGPGRRESPAGK